MDTKTNNKGLSVVIILLFIAVLLGGAFYFVFKSLPATPPPSVVDTDVATDLNKVVLTNTTAPKASVKPTVAPTPKPTPAPLKPDNGLKGTYQVGMGSHDGPTVSQVIFDPLDVKKGQTLNLSVRTSFTSSINSVTAVLTADNSTQNITFSLSSGTNLDGVWNGSVTLNDSVDYKYILTITSKSSNGKSSTVTVAPRS